MANVVLSKLCKSFGDNEVVRDFNLDIADGEFLVLLGPSGCGKSTTLRMVAGLEEVTSGEIIIDGKVVNDEEPKDRNIAMVFQNYALYPHMTVQDNLAFGLRMQGMKKDGIRSRVDKVSSMLQLSELLERFPAELSGGQRQRVAMGRTIVRTPVAFLFDEPLSNLDAVLRMELRTELRKLHLQLKTTSIYVTHDQVEAMTLADRIVVMRDGEIEQVGTPKEIFHRPATLYVAKFIGNPQMNLHEMEVEQAGGVQNLVTDGLRIPITEISADRAAAGNLSHGQKVMVGIRPSDIHIERDGQSTSCYAANMELTEMLGAESLIEFKIGNRNFTALVKDDFDIQRGDNFKVGMDFDKLHIFQI